MRIEDFFKPIVYVTARVTQGCNIKCTYCKVDSLSASSPKMSIETAKRAAELVISNSDYPLIGFNIHGGEPLLMPDEWFEEITGFASQLAKENSKEIYFPVATNGTLLSEERLLKLHALGIRFAMSCDGPPPINDVMRERGKTVQKTYELFRKHGIYCGIMTVISRGNYDKMKEVMDWFRQEGIYAFLTNYLEVQGRGMHRHLLSSREMYESGVQILDHMCETQISVANDDMLRKAVWFSEGRKNEFAFSCHNVECHAGRHMIAVDVDGSITVCGSADTSDFLIGNIFEEIDDALYKEVLGRFHGKGTWLVRCFDCPARLICNYGCTTGCNKSDSYRENMCEYTRLMWTHFCENPEKPFYLNQILRQKDLKYQI